MYEYKMVQVPPHIEVQAGKNHGGEAAAYMQKIVDANATNGWEFYRVDPIGVNVKPGCLSALFGQKDVSYTYYVISFRKQK
ncbi:MAG: hypothetical protein KF789_14990 [Bdellovibrionaceae bacterium]|nr:hypothetical protein [Pseudobdellovibrionaceae bacterium]